MHRTLTRHGAAGRQVCTPAGDTPGSVVAGRHSLKRNHTKVFAAADRAIHGLCGLDVCMAAAYCNKDTLDHDATEYNDAAEAKGRIGSLKDIPQQANGCLHEACWR